MRSPLAAAAGHASRSARRAWPGAPAAALGLCALLAGCGGSQAGSRAGSRPDAAVAKLDVKLQPPAQLREATPQFALRDSRGRLVRLSQFRGRAVILTFIYDHCPDVCPAIVGRLHTAAVALGAQASKVQIIAVSVDPKGDTPATVRRFLAAHLMTGRMEYLIGSRRELAPVWRAFGIGVQGSPESREVSHSAALFGITGHGSAVVLYPPTFDPGWLVHDAPLLARE